MSVDLIMLIGVQILFWFPMNHGYSGNTVTEGAAQEGCSEASQFDQACRAWTLEEGCPGWYFHVCFLGVFIALQIFGPTRRINLVITGRVISGCKPLTERALFLPNDGGVVGGLGCWPCLFLPYAQWSLLPCLNILLRTLWSYCYLLPTFQRGFDSVNLLIFQTYGAYVCQSLCVTLDACHGASVLHSNRLYSGLCVPMWISFAGWIHELYSDVYG